MKCGFCGQDLDTGNLRDNQIYCSPKCREQANNTKRKKMRECLNCGKETSKRYCCLKCGTEYRNKNRLKKLISGHKNTGFSEQDKKEIIEHLVDEFCND